MRGKAAGGGPQAAVVLWLLASALWAGGGKALLLEVGKGVLPNSGPEGTKISLAEQPELGGVCMKVVFENDNWLADTRGRDWSGFATLTFDVLNPSDKPVNLNLTIKHKGSRDYDTRVDKPLVAKPGKSTLEVNLAGLANNDGSRPDLSRVNIWSLDGPKGATLYFGGLWLEGGAAPAPAAAEPAPAAPGQSLRATGSFDVTIHGLAGLPAAGDQGVRIKGTFDVTLLGPAGLSISAATGEAQPGAPPAAAPRTADLIPVSKGTLPPDVADCQVSLVDEPQLGGVALKVVFAKDAWFADSNLKLKDWRGFGHLRFKAINPGKEPVTLGVTIKHQGSKDYDTRFDKSLALAPGLNQVDIPLAGLANNDGSPADLSAVRIFTVGCGADATVLFGDFVLETGQ